MYSLERLPTGTRERAERMASWRGLRARELRGRMPFLRHRLLNRTARQPDLPAKLFRRCGHVADMVRACVLVMPWSQTHATKMPKPVLDWLHPERPVDRCDRCFGNYLAVQQYFQAWVSSQLGGNPLPARFNTKTLDGGQITEQEIRCIVNWVCARLDAPVPSEEEDLPPAA